MKTFFLAAALLAVHGFAAAEQYRSPLGYTITLPPGWHLTTETGRESFFSRTGGDDSLGASVGQRDASVALSSDRILKRVDLSDVKFTVDEAVRHNGLPARRLEANASSEGVALFVRAIAIKPAEDSKVSLFQVWGAPAAMAGDPVRGEVDQMLASFQPDAPAASAPAPASSDTARLQCAPVDPKSKADAFHLGVDGTALEVEKPAGANRSFYKIEKVRSETGATVIAGERINEAIACAGSCPTVSFTLTVPKTRGKNAALVLETKGFSETSGSFDNRAETAYGCRAARLESLKQP